MGRGVDLLEDVGLGGVSDDVGWGILGNGFVFAGQLFFVSIFMLLRGK